MNINIQFFQEYKDKDKDKDNQEEKLLADFIKQQSSTL